VLEVANVIWCTGFRPDYSWIDVEACDDRGHPVHDRGVVPGRPGLYFLGLDKQYAATSEVITGVGRDARYLANRIAQRSPARQAHELKPAGV
jgi:putative flavoprotein involved in K+ transport